MKLLATASDLSVLDMSLPYTWLCKAKFDMPVFMCHHTADKTEVSTFDNAYADYYHQVWPLLLKELDTSACVF